MGLIAEPETNEFLHIRTYEDKLLFVVTPNSTNYKVMYNALKVEQLTKAIKNGSNEVNSLKSSINTNQMSIQTLSDQARSIRIADIEPLKEVRDRLKSQMSILDKIESLKKLIYSINKCEEQLGALALLDRFRLEPINEVLASKLGSTSRLLNKRYESSNLLSRYSNISDLNEININIVNSVQNLVNKKNSLDEKIKGAGNLVIVGDLAEISEVAAVHLNKISGLIDKNRQLSEHLSIIDISECSEVDTTIVAAITKIAKIQTLVEKINTDKVAEKQMNDYVIQVENYLKQCGVAMETCPKCGEAIIFDLDKLGE